MNKITAENKEKLLAPNMYVRGELYEAEWVENTEAHHKAAEKYLKAYLINLDGTEEPLMFTEKAIKEARNRPKRHPEDLRARPPKWKLFLRNLFW